MTKEDHIDHVDQIAVEELLQAFIRFQRKQLEGTKDRKFSEAKALVILSHHQENEGLTVLELSKKLHVTSPFVTQIINQLEAKGLVIRSNDQKDRRIVRLLLTEEGMTAANIVKQTVHKRYALLVEHLGRDDSRKLVELLNKTFDFFEEQTKKIENEGDH